MRAWPEKFDGGTCLEMVKDLEDTMRKWLVDLKLRNGALCLDLNLLPKLLSINLNISSHMLQPD